MPWDALWEKKGPSTHKNVTDSRYTPVHRGMSIHHSTMPEFRNASPACARRRQASAKKNAIFDQVIAKYDANADGLWGWDDFNRLQRDLDQAGVADGATRSGFCWHREVAGVAGVGLRGDMPVSTAPENDRLV